MWLTARKTAPSVRDGRVQRKNRWARTPPRDAPRVIRERPPRGFRHILTVADVESFLELVPAELTCGVEHVVLSADPSSLGWYRRGVVAVCAWPRELWAWWSKDFVDEHRASLERYGVPMKLHFGRVLCDFSERQIRAFQLLRVLMHELGHHADVERGEPYANRFEVEWDQRLWSKYVARFGEP